MRLRERSYHLIWTGYPSYKFKSRVDHTAWVACFFQLCQCYPIEVSAMIEIYLHCSVVIWPLSTWNVADMMEELNFFLMKWSYLFIYLFIGQVVQHANLSSPIRDWTQASCIGRRSHNHWTAREVPGAKFFVLFLFGSLGSSVAALGLSLAIVSGG